MGSRGPVSRSTILTMKRAILIAAVVASGCCRDANDLEVHGEALADLELVLSLAQESCGRPIVGRIEVVTEARGEENGHCQWSARGCPMDAWVLRPEGERPSAVYSSMIHEIGHWCLWSSDEDAVNAWATPVIQAAQRAIGDLK